MCPVDTYVNGFAGAFGKQTNEDLGFHGLKIKCSTKDIKHFNFQEDRATYYVANFHNSKPGNFISGVRIKYI